MQPDAAEEDGIGGVGLALGQARKLIEIRRASLNLRIHFLRGETGVEEERGGRWALAPGLVEQRGAQARVAPDRFHQSPLGFQAPAGAFEVGGSLNFETSGLHERVSSLVQ